MAGTRRSARSPVDPGASAGGGVAARRLGKRAEPYLLLLPALAVLALFFFGPALFNIVLSLQRVSLFELGRGGQWIGLANFVALVRDPLTQLALGNTVLWLTLVTVSLRVGFGLALALLLDSAVIRRWRLTGTRSIGILKIRKMSKPLQ